MTLYHILAYLSLASSVIIALLIINHREVEQNRCISSATLLLAVYIFGYCVEITSTNYDTAFIGLIIEYISYPFISPLIFLFALSHSGVRVPKPVKVLLFLLPIAQCVLAITSHYHSYYYTEMEFTPPPIFAQLRVTGTTIYYLCFGYVFVLLIASAITILINAFSQKGAKRTTEILMAIAFSIPFVTAVFYLLDMTPWQYDLTPVFLCVTCIIICVCSLKYNYLQFLPAATSQMVDQMKDAFVVLDSDSCFINANISAKKLFPFLKTVKFGMEIPEDYRKYFGTEKSEFEFSITESDRESFYKASVGVIDKRGKTVCNTFIFYDITDAKMLINELDEQASYDKLTGIYNRATLMRYLYILQEKSDIEDVSSAILMVNLDNYKHIYDTLGLNEGDKTIAEVVNRIRPCLRDNDIFGRYSVDEFCVAIFNTDQNTALEEAEKIREKIAATPFDAAGISFSVTVSIGISLYFPVEEKKIETIITEADEALNDSKESGKNCCNVFYKSMNIVGVRR
ncbi:MAG: diguanylate cyclase [Ruminococcus sp.]|jgi:diguanylate cyclase (GGDEF)-like protein|nr:diguanylate cyclase [Ruminococcus sp.]